MYVRSICLHVFVFTSRWSTLGAGIVLSLFMWVHRRRCVCMRICMHECICVCVCASSLIVISSRQNFMRTTVSGPCICQRWYGLSLQPWLKGYACWQYHGIWRYDSNPSDSECTVLHDHAHTDRRLFLASRLSHRCCGVVWIRFFWIRTNTQLISAYIARGILLRGSIYALCICICAFFGSLAATRLTVEVYRLCRVCGALQHAYLTFCTKFVALVCLCFCVHAAL